MKAREQFIALLVQAFPLILEMAQEDNLAKGRQMRTHARAYGRRDLLRLLVETTCKRRDLTPEDAPRMVAVVEAIAKEVEGAFADSAFDEELNELYAEADRAVRSATERPPSATGTAS